MISFQYKKEGNHFIIELKTDSTEIGTLNRMSAAFYVLGWDILSGEIETIEENGKSYALDIFKIRNIPTGEKTNQIHQIGILMDTIISKKESIHKIFEKSHEPDPDLADFFKEHAIMDFEDTPKTGFTKFYFESPSRRGLLFYLTKVLAENQINIIRAFIKTEVPTNIAKDTFYLQDSQGKMFANTEIVDKLLDLFNKPHK